MVVGRRSKAGMEPLICLQLSPKSNTKIAAPSPPEQQAHLQDRFLWPMKALLLFLLIAAAPALAKETATPSASANHSVHWAFAPVPPLQRGQSLDRLLEAHQLRAGLLPQPATSSGLWLRRAFIQLTGLPPSLGQLRDFERQDSPLQRQRLVEQLLASPAHGERWARHFMDIWRYSDWHGLGAQLRYSQKHLWHWRDWIIESLNADLGYDHMLRDMLAADELAPQDAKRLRATGFLARSYYLFNRTTWLDDVVEHTSKAFMGLTMNCVKCHSHKYDPISHEEYYAMRAVFEPYHVRLDALPGEGNFEHNALPRAYDLHLQRPTHLHLKGNEKDVDTSHIIAPAVPKALAFAPLRIEPINLPALGAKAPTATIEITEGKKKTQRSAAWLKALEGPDETDKTRWNPLPTQSSGRRRALAQWLTDSRHPLTARVIVNHIWLRHFGQPLVANVFDFGKQSPPPPLQDVLDHLAAELMANQWSLKHLHRLIVSSRAFAASSSLAHAPEANRRLDPDNKLHWRMTAQRLDAHALRDCLLALSGLLDARIGGPTVESNKGDALRRRSLYFNHHRDEGNAMLEAFDNASPLECYRRNESIIPQQALAMMNGRTPLECSQQLAKGMQSLPEDNFLRDAFELIIASPPTTAELETGREGLQQLGSNARAREALIHTLFNHQDFITLR
jgi:hypothetical protein